MKISMDGKGRYQDNIFVERLWRTVKYEEVYLKAHASILEAQRGLADYFRFYNGTRMWWKGTLMEGGVHLDRKPNHWQESRDSHLVRP